MKKPLEMTKAKIIGSTAVRLEGDPTQCRVQECNSGKVFMLQISTVDFLCFVKFYKCSGIFFCFHFQEINTMYMYGYIVHVHKLQKK